jgi:hypothetical protein
MEQTALATRRIDTSGRRPLTYYSRTMPIIGGKIVLPTKFDQWFDYNTSVIKFGLLCTMEDILKNPDWPLEKVISNKERAPLFNSMVLKWPWTMLEDIQDAAKRLDSKKLQELEKRINQLKSRSVNVETLVALVGRPGQQSLISTRDD